MDADQSQCKQRLAQAEAALHSLMTGTRLVEVRKGDRNVRYTETTKADLVSYIEQLRAQCGDCPGNGGRNRRRPIGFIQ